MGMSYVLFACTLLVLVPDHGSNELAYRICISEARFFFKQNFARLSPTILEEPRYGSIRVDRQDHPPTPPKTIH